MEASTVSDTIGSSSGRGSATDGSSCLISAGGGRLGMSGTSGKMVRPFMMNSFKSIRVCLTSVFNRLNSSSSLSNFSFVSLWLLTIWLHTPSLKYRLWHYCYPGRYDRSEPATPPDQDIKDPGNPDSSPEREQAASFFGSRLAHLPEESLLSGTAN